VSFKFHKYNSIENSYRQKWLNQIKQLPIRGDWVVSEKVDGSNFSFHFDGTEWRIGKRSTLIANDSNFGGAQSMLDKRRDSLIALCQEAMSMNEDSEQVTVFGEIFGGSYPHKDVPRDNSAKRVQGKVFYCPWNDFYGFDIEVDSKLIDDDTAQLLFKKHNLVHAVQLFRGSLEECLEYFNEYPTTIAALYGLPAIDNNNCEGNVIKPVRPYYANCGRRIILKNKNEKYNEKSHKPKEPKEVVELSEAGQEVLDELMTFLTENRLRNVLSKIGEITDKQFGMLLGKLAQDAWEDFEKDNKESFDALEAKDRVIIKKQLNKGAGEIIRPNVINIIDGEF